MPPVNDNLANAILLTGASGSTTFDLTGATSQVGEPANNGSTIWYLWRNNIKTSVTVSADDWYAGFTMTFGTRWRPGQTQPTLIPVVVTAYKASNAGDAPPYAFGDLTFLAQGSTWGWCQQGQVTVEAFENMTGVGSGPGVGDMIAIRVDVWPGGAQGTGTLWWELWNEKLPFPCNESVNGAGDDDGACLSVVRVSTTGPTSVVYPSGGGNAGAGLYIMRYRGGVMTYDSAVATAEDGIAHWVVGKLPPLTDQTWIPGQPAPLVTGYFWGWQYANSGTQYGHFDEPNMPIPPTTSNSYGDNWGYWTPRLAFQAVGCMRKTFQHDGTSPITMLYTDKDFSDDGPASCGAPMFVLSKAVPKWVPLYVCSTKVSTGVYDVTFYMQSNNWYDFPNVSATATLTGGISASNTIGPRTFFGGGVTSSFTLRLTLSSPTARNQTATVQFSDPSGVIANLNWSLAPYIVQTGKASQSPCNISWSKGCHISFDVRGIATDALAATIGTGAGSDIASFANGSCVTSGTYSLGACGCGSSFNISYTPNVGTSAPYNFPITFTDTYATFPVYTFQAI